MPCCNVILISVDSLRKDHVGLFGYKRNTTPNLDQWSQTAFVFENYVTSAYLTPITERSVHTSLYPTRSGVINFVSALPENIPTLAEILKSYGFTTLALGTSPEFGRKVNGKKLFDRGFDEYSFKENEERHFRDLPLDALEKLKDLRAQRFFLWLPMGSVHWPYNLEDRPRHFPDPSYDGVFAKSSLDGVPLSRVLDGKYYEMFSRNSVPLKTEDLQFIVDRYDDGILHTDEFLGKFFHALEETGLDQNTIVILHSEHGESLGERGYFAHYDIYESTIRTPLLMKIPGMPGRRLSQLISSVDILPTLLSLLKIPPPAETDGFSFLEALKNPGFSAQVRPWALVERIPLWEHVTGELMHDLKRSEEFRALDFKEHFYDIAVHTPEWKLIYRKAREVQSKYGVFDFYKKRTYPEFELYNIATDPEEKNNRIAEKKEIAKDLKKILSPYIDEFEQRKRSVIQNQKDIQPYF